MNNTLQKTHDKSYFKHFHNESPLAREIFRENSDTKILQIMKIDDGHYLAELVNSAVLEGENQ